MARRPKLRIEVESRLLDERWEQAGDELRRIDPDEFRRLLELGEAIVHWYRARPPTEAEPRDRDEALLLPKPRRGELN